MLTLLIRACAFLLVFVLLLSTGAAAQLVLYDNFDSNLIDPAKWQDLPADPEIREAVRQLVPTPGLANDRRLHLSQRAYSATTDDNDTSGGGFGLMFPVPNSVTEILFTVTVNSAQAVDCAANPSLEFVTAAEFRGAFFNTEASPTSQLGDVSAFLGVERNPAVFGNALTVHGAFGRCDDQSCGTQTVLGSVVLGTVAAGAPAILHLKWDQPNHQFVFQLNNGALVSSPYTVSDSSPSFFPFKIIDLARVVPHCTTTPRPFTAIDAFFDDVFVNAIPVSAAHQSANSSFILGKKSTAPNVNDQAGLLRHKAAL